MSIAYRQTLPQVEWLKTTHFVLAHYSEIQTGLSWTNPLLILMVVTPWLNWAVGWLGAGRSWYSGMAEFLSGHSTYPLAQLSDSLYVSIDPTRWTWHAATSATFHYLKLVISLGQTHGKETTQDCECQEALFPVAADQTDSSTSLSDPGWLTVLPYSKTSRSCTLWQHQSQALRSFI